MYLNSPPENSSPPQFSPADDISRSQVVWAGLLLALLERAQEGSAGLWPPCIHDMTSWGKFQFYDNYEPGFKWKLFLMIFKSQLSQNQLKFLKWWVIRNMWINLLKTQNLQLDLSVHILRKFSNIAWGCRIFWKGRGLITACVGAKILVTVVE